ncbi:Helix-turn-helix domain-containing protein [Chitinophaga sp. CF118]|uniref:helix-turn-helix domain-containing protein n=1 Tax=Chitinophaga sp. CF118 TaxID=1884367 RepID=UPI0008E2432F|nr:helix-turn-helix transcriptional regulator [Chitinophaga sp. CF118]SFE67020.1 Helix-turn-helix domain-containing protein [Chitinophaga sp. CF118]
MQTINSISQFHRLLSLPDPLHPLVSVVHVEDIRPVKNVVWEGFFLNFYTISLKRNVQAKGKYGQSYYDFDKGVMSFTAPRQLQSHVMLADVQQKELGTGYVLLLHPDFLLQNPLAYKILTFGYFDYSINEALHLSVREEQDILHLFRKIEQECEHIDTVMQEIVLSQIDLILNYCNRFYQRQFITRKLVNSDLLSRLDQLLSNYFDENKAIHNGLPVVKDLAEQLQVSQRYLSDMARILTGQNTQQLIHGKLIEKAKERLITTNLSVSEIAYELGFEHSQSFNKLFKNKTNVTPLEFRSSFN